ncbi:gamma-glutamylcyclotransferase [Pararoseomonas indoligenes]|uniref:glutathione-specific gamma-glutamylcyclotransferase n=1 Tax=Roseomonas indoligenes TaxID=2820811 RepID=A0A940MR84_9PROT|nr:gamma-glutamylcyclotransferase [Pararoseomonas indoligenes]MBP0492558.1 gamma-glutamylcyclotransferase [Pararoseomonas indoligenes]
MPQLTPELIARVPPPPEGPPVPAPDELRLRAEMTVFLHDRDPKLGIWVFAYGALMWRHGEAAPDIVAPARLPGFARRYDLSDVHDRGTPARPGLTLGLEPNAALACAGLLLHLPGPDVAAHLWPVWKQEMGPGFYVPEWHDALLTTAHDGSGAPVRALCFMTRRGHRLHVGERPVHETADTLSRAAGPNGSGAAYLMDAAGILRAKGMRDAMLESLEAEVARRLQTMPPISGEPGRSAG